MTTSTDFPTVNPYQTDPSPGFISDIFVAKLNSSGNGIDYSTYIGGSGDDVGNGIAVDASGNAYIIGWTNSTDFPTVNPYQTDPGDAESDIIVAKLNNLGNGFLYSTYLGGSSYETGNDIAIDASGNAYVTGETGSTDYPTQNEYQTDPGDGLGDAFITKLDVSGGLGYSTYLGGSGIDRTRSITVDAAGDAYVCGITTSADFPVVSPFQTFPDDNDAGNAFVTKLSLPEPNRILSLDDAGSSSLRWAIDNLNADPDIDTLFFDVSGTIHLVTPLPTITDDSIVILGSSAPGGAYSVVIDGSGLAKTINSGLIVASSHNKIEGLTISGFAGNGIEITGASAVNNTITNNLIYDNGGLGIDLNDDGVTINDGGDADNGPNDLVNYPEIDSLIMNPDSSFWVYGRASDSGVVEFFVAHPEGDMAKPADPSGNGEAWSFIGTDTADINGNFDYLINNTIKYFSLVTATCTDTMGNTSEFSPNFNLIPTPLIIVGYSPINIEVINPAGDSIGKLSDNTPFNTIGSNATYDDNVHDSITINYPIEGDYIIIIRPQGDPPLGALYSIGITIDGSLQAIVADNADVPASGTADTIGYIVAEGYHYMNGDASRDSNVNLIDILYLIAYLYDEPAGPAPDPILAGDANCDQALNLIDILYLISNLYDDPPGPEPCHWESHE